MTEIEKVKSEIKVLEAKLSLLEEMKNYKPPAEEAYKRVYGGYPDTSTDDYGRYYHISWRYFEQGYNAAQEDYKVGEYQETENDKVLHNKTKTCCYYDDPEHLPYFVGN